MISEDHQEVEMIKQVEETIENNIEQIS